MNICINYCKQLYYFNISKKKKTFLFPDVQLLNHFLTFQLGLDLGVDKANNMVPLIIRAPKTYDELSTSMGQL